MPYGKRYYRKTYKSNRYRKTNRTFTRFNTYRNRSAKAQAYQIYKLNKKVNRLNKQTKPECLTQIDESIANNIELATSGTSSYDYEVKALVSHKSGVFTGKKAFIKNVQVWGSIQFDNSGTGLRTQTADCYLRLIFFRPKTVRTGPNINEVVSNWGASSHDYTYYLKCPLAPGFSSKYRMVKNKLIKLSPTNGTMKQFKFTIKYNKNLRGFLLSDTSSAEYPLNTLYCIGILVNVGANQTSTTADLFSAQMFHKIAYYDDTDSNDVPTP